MPEKWRVVKLETHDAFTNMAIDEAVSEAVAKGKANPTIRFYRWKPSAVSIGYFQSLQEEVNLEKCRKMEIDYVRRRTGGGAVYHDYNGEITYSVIGKEKLFPKDLTESYREICGWIIKGLKELGIESEFHPINDIISGGKKISGNAQTRRGGVLLQHGTVLHGLDVEKMFTVLKVTKEKISDKLIKSVKERVTSIQDVKETSIEETEEALLKGFTEGKKFEIGEWENTELERAEQIANERYRKEEWNRLR